MIECHPLLQPVVNLAKPVVHAVRHWHPKIVGAKHVVHRVAHRAATAVTPPPGVMTVCQRVAGPIVAGGLVLLPPASAVPPVGGVGGFPGAGVPEYGAPAFGGPGFAGPGGYAFGPAAYPGVFAPIGGFAGGIPSPGFSRASTPGGPAVSPPAIVSPPGIAGTSVPDSPILFASNQPDSPVVTPPTPTISITKTSTPESPQREIPGQPTQLDKPANDSPPPRDNTPPTDSKPGNETPVVNTPEPASLLILAGALGATMLIRSRRRQG